MTTPELPARVSLGFRRDKHLSFTGLLENRTLPPCEASIAIRTLLQELYADATPCDGITIAKPRLGNHFRIRWTTQGGAKLRFYLATVKKVRPKYEVPSDDRVVRLRTMVESAYEMARPDGAKSTKTAFEVETEEYEARLLSGELVEPS